jgi:hypothetical protein
MPLLSHDGDHTIHRVEVLRTYSTGDHWQEWTIMHQDDEPPVPTIPVRYANRGDQRSCREQEPFRSYSASGACWQATGIHGFFDRGKADALVGLLLKHNPTVTVRIKVIRVSQHTSIVATVRNKNSEAA